MVANKTMDNIFNVGDDDCFVTNRRLVMINTNLH
jgi:hypothetical protein